MRGDEPRQSLARFKRALTTGNLFPVRAAAKELPHMGLEDALTITLVMERQDDEVGFERAAAKWLARFVLEVPGLAPDDLRAGADALHGLPPSEARANCPHRKLAPASQPCAATTAWTERHRTLWLSSWSSQHPPPPSCCRATP